MSELFKIGPTPAKVTVARPVGRAAADGGAGPIEAVPPIVLDNDDALGFLRKGLRQDRENRNAGRAEALGTEAGTRRYLPDHDRDPQAAAASRDSGPDQPVLGATSLARASSNGFVAHVMARDSEAPGDLSSATVGELTDWHLRTSDAYRRAGAEPLLYSGTSQLVSVAI